MVSAAGTLESTGQLQTATGQYETSLLTVHARAHGVTSVAVFEGFLTYMYLFLKVFLHNYHTSTYSVIMIKCCHVETDLSFFSLFS